MRFDGERIQIGDASDGPLTASFVIAGTGYVVDLSVIRKPPTICR